MRSCLVVWRAPWRIKLLFALFLALLISPIIGFRWHHQRKYRTTQTLLRFLATAIESYAVDNAWYPAWTIGENGIHSPLPAQHPAASLPSFHQPIHAYPYMKEGSTRWILAPMCLTTPIPYLIEYPVDPYASRSRDFITFVYYSINKRGSGWILISPGPDGDYDIDPTEHYDATLPILQQIKAPSKNCF